MLFARASPVGGKDVERVVGQGATRVKRGSDWSRLDKLLQNSRETDESFGRNVVPKNLATGLMIYRSLWGLPVAIG